MDDAAVPVISLAHHFFKGRFRHFVSKRSIVGTSLGRLILSTISCNTLNGV